MKRYILNLLVFSSLLSAQTTYWVDGTNGNDNDDGTADVIIGLSVVSATTEYVDAARYTFPEAVTVNGANDDGGTMPGSTSQIELCDIVVDTETNSAIFGDGSFLADSSSGSTYGCLSTTYHTHSVDNGIF